MSKIRPKLSSSLALLLVAAGIVVATPQRVDAEPSPPGGSAISAAPDAAGAAIAARTNGKRVEDLSARTETTQVFAEPDGTFTLQQHAVPVRVRKDGAWRTIDTTLMRRPDGSVAPVAALADVVFSGGGNSAMVSISAGDKRLSVAWSGKLPEPAISGNTATYSEVLPGVDLVLMATVDGYRQHLVVKNRAAAANPALRRMVLRTTASGLTVRSAPDGSMNAVDKAGRAVFVAGAPVMWDTPGPSFARANRSAEALEADLVGRQRPVRVETDGERVVLVPDAAMLDAPGTGFPVVIDPDWGSGAAAWLHLNLNSPNQNGWGWDQGSGAKVGKGWDTSVIYRSFFQFDVGGLAGTTVNNVFFRITLNHSGSCGDSPVDLYHTGGIWNGMTWGNTGNGWWYRWLDQRSAHANEGGGCGANQSDAGMEFNSGGLREVMQNTANAAGGSLTLGLRAPNEGDRYQWKKFHQSTAYLQVSYNRRPDVPAELSTVPPTACGTATAPTPLNTTTPTFSARLADPDLDLVHARLEVREGDTVLSGVDSATIRSGGAVAWPPLAAGVLPADQPTRVFNYRAENLDGSQSSGFTTPCYFTVDRTIPGTPAVTSTDFPDGKAVTAVGQVGTLRLGPGFGPTGAVDTDVAGYRYGFQQDKLTGWAPADTAGDATIPMVLWQTNRTLYVQSVDRAGNPSVNDAPCVCTVWDLRATASGATPAHQPGDVNGDGRGDATALFDLGNNRTAVWTAVTNAGGGVYPPYIAWDSGINGGFPGYRTKSASGDFNGDGLTDVAVFREDPDRRLRLFFLRSDSHRLDADAAPEWEGPVNSPEWTLEKLQLSVTDANGDGRADLVVLLAQATNQYSFQVFAGATGGLTAPTAWFTAAAGSVEPARAQLFTGDFDGDGRGDAGVEYDTGNWQTKLWLHYSTGTAFAAGYLAWDSGPNAWNPAPTTPLVGNFDGDTAGVGGRGRDDIMFMADYGPSEPGRTKFWMFPGRAANTTLAVSLWWDSGAGNTFWATDTALSAGDVNADGKADILAFHGAATATAKVQTFLTNSTGTGASTDLAAPAWSGPIGAKAATFSPEPGRAYRLQPRHSNKCVQPPSATSEPHTQLIQSSCIAGSTVQMWRFEPVGPYYRIRNVATDQCIDVRGYDRTPGSVVHQYPCHLDANQQWRLQFLNSAGLDNYAHVRAAHSDLCLDIMNYDTNDGAVVNQYHCESLDHQYYLRMQP